MGCGTIVNHAKPINKRSSVKRLHKSIKRYNDGFDLALPPKKLAVAMEKVFHQHGLLVNQSIPLQLTEIEKTEH